MFGRRKCESMPQGGGDVNSKDPCERAEGYRTQGNVFANKGKYAEACSQYKQGVEALENVEEADREKASELTLAMHLNLALTQLRRGASLSPSDIPALAQLRKEALLAAVEHGDAAISINAQCVKAWYRRGCAYYRLGEHPGRRADVKRAVADFKKVLELDPENSDAQKKMEVLKQECGSWAFADTATDSPDGVAEEASGHGEEQTPAANSIESAIRPPDARELSHKLTLSAAKMSFYSDDKQIFKDLQLDLRAGWSVGFIGMEESGSVLAQLMCGRLQPDRGRLIHHGCVAAPPGSAVSTAVFALVTASTSLLFLASAFFEDPFTAVALHLKDMSTLAMTLAGITVGMFMLMIVMEVGRRNANRAQHQCTVITSNAWGSHKERISPSLTVEQAIGEALPQRLGSSDRRRCVAAMLQAAGFSLLEESKGKSSDSLKYGALSDVQKHLIYILRCLASMPRVLICDEILKGLFEAGTSAPSKQQVQIAARVLRMLRRLQEELDIAILYISSEPRELRLAVDGLSVAEGSLGPVAEVLDAPEHPAAAKYYSNCHGASDKLAEFYKKLAEDSDLSGPWLPVTA